MGAIKVGFHRDDAVADAGEREQDARQKISILKDVHVRPRSAIHPVPDAQR
jgi:hypothetical protein